MHHTVNAMHQAAAQAGERNAGTRLGIVEGYDPVTYSVRVSIEPEGLHTRWIPLAAVAAGNGFGILAAPKLGEAVVLVFQEDSILYAIAGLRLFTDDAKPPVVQSGEVLVRHESGSRLFFRADGSIDMVARGTLTSSAPQWNHAGPVHITGDVLITGNETVSQNITAGVDIFDRNGTKGSVGHIRDVYDTHTHSGVSTGIGTTAVPNQQL